MSKIEISVKCVQCGKIKKVDKSQDHIPMCDNCYMPMLAEKVEIK